MTPPAYLLPSVHHSSISCLHFLTVGLWKFVTYAALTSTEQGTFGWSVS